MKKQKKPLAPQLKKPNKLEEKDLRRLLVEKYEIETKTNLATKDLKIEL